MRCGRRLSHNPRPGFPIYAVFCFFKQGNQSGAFRRGRCEGDARLDFRQHGAGGEMAFDRVFFRLGGGEFIQPGFLGCAEMEGCFFHGGEDNQEVGV